MLSDSEHASCEPRHFTHTTCHAALRGEEGQGLGPDRLHLVRRNARGGSDRCSDCRPPFYSGRFPRLDVGGALNTMAAFVGIDLGTTNSVVACRNAYGRPEVIPNREGKNVTPSVLYFGSDPPAVGQEAKEWGRLGGEAIASFFKPHMGDPHYRLRFQGRDYTATDLSAL